MTNETPPNEGPEPPTTAALLRASQAGDAVALESLLTRNYAMLRAFIRLRVDPVTRARERISDVTQSVCREVLQRADRFVYLGDAAFRGWLCEAALRKMRDKRGYHLAQKRDLGREAPPGDSNHGQADLEAVYRTSFDPEGKAIKDEQLALMERVFDTLPENMREVLTLRTVCGMSYVEIAELLGGNHTTLRKLTQRGRARLAVRLQSELGDT